MPAPTHHLAPHHSHQSTSIRKIYLQNLSDLIHVCLSHGDLYRARRAWSILIRCREVDWRSRWYWGLQCLNASAATETQLTSTFQGEQYEGREAEKWLRSVRVSAREAEKPSLLHALVLHLIKHERHRAALDELDTYLTSYPYLLSGPLHTYAGLLAFYLAQPVLHRVPLSGEIRHLNQTSPAPSAHNSRASSPSSQSSRSTIVPVGPPASSKSPNPTLLRQARGYFNKALNLNGQDEVALEFINLIDRPDRRDTLNSDAECSRRTDSQSFSGKSDDGKLDDKDDEDADEDEVEDDDMDTIGESVDERKEDDKGDESDSGNTEETDPMSEDDDLERLLSDSDNRDDDDDESEDG